MRVVAFVLLSSTVALGAALGAAKAATCPPGSHPSKDGKGACVIEPKAKVACVVEDAAIGAELGAYLSFGALEMPPLPTLAPSNADDLTAKVEGKEKTADAASLVAAAGAWDALEGAAAATGSTAGPVKQKSSFAARDHAASRAIAVRRAFLARFPDDDRAGDERVLLARALLRRAAYVVVGPSVAADRKEAHALLVSLVDAGLPTRAARDAAFMLEEQAVRDRDLAKVVVLGETVLRWASAKAFADDHAFLAAAHARVAQARLEAGDLARAKLSLDEAIAAGLLCAPRTECVTAASGARNVLAATWAATQAPARSMVAILARGTLPRNERVRPLLKLAELYAKGTGSECAAAEAEARAWEKTF